MMASPLMSAGIAGVHRMVASRLYRLWETPTQSLSPKTLREALLLCTELYNLGLRHDQRKAQLQKRRLPAFVISVGNLVVGGTGKTPFTLWLANHLKEHGRRPAIISRGYGRLGDNIERVPSSGETRSQVNRLGDEPVLMARRADTIPVWVGRKRYFSGKAAIQSGEADLLLMDDGFQHLALERDLDLVLLDAHNPFGNGSLLPAGPLREPVAHLQRAHAVILTRADDSARVLETRKTIRRLFPEKPVFACRHRPLGLRTGLDGPLMPPEAVLGRPAVAFAGIAHPEKFFRSLSQLGVRLWRSFAYPDHHPYEACDFHRLMDATLASKAAFLVTTGKDFVRLPAEIQSAVVIADMELDFGPESEELRLYLDGIIPPGH